MNGLSWLMYASIIVWIVLGGYLFFLGRKAASLETRLRRLERSAVPDGQEGKKV